MPDIPDITVGYPHYPADAADLEPVCSSQAAPLPLEDDVKLFNALMSGSGDSLTEGSTAAGTAPDTANVNTSRIAAGTAAGNAAETGANGMAAPAGRDAAGSTVFQRQAAWTASAQTQGAQASPF
ncbi:MAG: hypothetical protein J5828_05565, partial [Desulfovibrionaceae bacterium]|nr:hypothetical protein [Desulfovibrionaceae bacterium]